MQNYDGSSSYGKTWHWAGAAHSNSAPLLAPSPDTASEYTYKYGNRHSNTQRTTVSGATTAGDDKLLYGQGRPMAKDASGSGSSFSIGVESENDTGGGGSVESRFIFEGTVAPTDLDRATDVREKGRVGIFGTSMAYAGSSGRVLNEAIGRDLNPLGRGTGSAYVGGDLNLGRISPMLPLSFAASGTGNSVNNQKSPKDRVPPGCRELTDQERQCAVGWANYHKDADPTLCPAYRCYRELADCYCTPEEWHQDPESCQRLYCCCDSIQDSQCYKNYCHSNPQCCPECHCGEGGRDCDPNSPGGGGGKGGGGGIAPPPPSPKFIGGGCAGCGPKLSISPDPKQGGGGGGSNHSDGYIRCACTNAVPCMLQSENESDGCDFPFPTSQQYCWYCNGLPGQTTNPCDDSLVHCFGECFMQQLNKNCVDAIKECRDDDMNWLECMWHLRNKCPTRLTLTIHNCIKCCIRYEIACIEQLTVPDPRDGSFKCTEAGEDNNSSQTVVWDCP